MDITRRQLLKAGLLAAAGTPVGDIALSGPLAANVKQGETASLNYQLIRIRGPRLATKFSVSGLAAGWTANFIPASCQPDCIVTLQITAPIDALIDVAFIITVRAENSRAVAMANTNIIPKSAVFEPPPEPGENTRLGLHVTSDELAIWQARAVSGPYKTAGDVSTNSPGDWDRIVSKKNSFNSSPSSQRWTGKVTATCAQPFNPEPAQGLGDLIVAAGFYALVADDSTTRNNVRDELLAQAAEVGTDFSDRSRWCLDTPYGPVIDEATTHSNWLTRLIFAYDYIRSSLSGGNQATLDDWFYEAGSWNAQAYDRWLTTAIYPGRMSDNYSSPTDAGVGSGQWLTHFGGFQTDDWIHSWSNRGMGQMRIAGMVGVMLNDSDLITRAKRICKEWIKYGVFSDGTIGEMYRGVETSGFRNHGFSYSSLLLGPVVTMADALARTGDYEIYDYSTSTGYNGTAGGPKSISQIMTLLAGYVNHDVTRYGTESAGNNGNALYIIDTEDAAAGESIVDDTYMALGNQYYQSAYVKSIYTRAASGCPVYPSGGGATGGYPAFTGEWGVFPAILFMFGQNEGVVDPYP